MSDIASLLVAVERCQLCGRSKKQFTCKKCVTTGNFSSSNSIADGCASFALKKKRTKVVHSVRNATLQRIEPKLPVLTATNKKQTQIVILRDRICSIKEAIQVARTQVERDKDDNAKVYELLKEQKAFIHRIIEKIQKLKTSKRIEEKQIKHKQYLERLAAKEIELQNLRSYHVQALLRDIFPLSKRDVFPEFGTPPQSSYYVAEAPCSDVVYETTSSAESELEEATRTVHVGGQWISQTTEQTEHTIVDVGMPSSGDFMKYYEWLKSYRNEPKNAENQSSLHSNNLLSIPASLIYTAQLSDSAAFYLGINLPHCIEYINFGLLQISRQRLFKTVNMLAENVMQLCFSQHIPMMYLQANQVLNNLQVCLSTENLLLGKGGSFETFQFDLFECPFDSDSSVEELNYISDDSRDSSDDHEEVWDQLMDLTEERTYFDPDLSTMSLEQRSLSSSATGLVTSAAASVASALWPWKR